LVTTSNGQTPSACSAPAINCFGQSLTTRPTSAADIPIWKTITLGDYGTVAALRSAFDNSPSRLGIGDSVDEAIGRPSFLFTRSKLELDLVILSVADLGFPEDGASIDAIYNRALSIGLELCPPDVGLILRLKYLDQPRGEFLHVAMRPVALYNREPVDFSLGNDGKRLLIIGGDTDSQLVLAGAVRFVFVRPRPNATAEHTAPSNSADFAKR
jgi:hypothetical protein